MISRGSRIKLLSSALVAGFLLCCLFSFLFSQLQLRHERVQLPIEWFEELQLPPAASVRASMLNYDTFAADLTWIALVVNYGEGRRRWARFELLEPNATVVRDLDPRFRRVYDWFPAVYMTYRWPRRFDDVEVTRRFVEPGFDQFLTDSELPFHAAMSYVGVENPPEGPKRRYERIVELAELASLRGDSLANGVLPFYRAKLKRDDASYTAAAEVEFLATMLARATEDDLRRMLERRLQAISQKQPEVAEKLLAQTREFRSAHLMEGGYLAPTLYALVRR